MTTQNQIIIICALAFIAVPLGTFTTIKLIKKLSRPPVNTLSRTGDIELVDYIEPTRPHQIYNYPDLLESQRAISDYGRVPSYYTGDIPSYYTGTIPSYNTTDRFYINSPLELNSWNFSLLLVLIFLSITIGFIIFKYFKTNLYCMSILIPFSYFEVDFRDSFDWEFKTKIKTKITFLKIQCLTEDIIKLLNSLNDNENYSMSLSYISSYKEWKGDKGKIKPLMVENPIIINKESDPILITQFIMENLDKKGYFITNWLFKDYSLNSMDPVILAVLDSIKVDI